MCYAKQYGMPAHDQACLESLDNVEALTLLRLGYAWGYQAFSV